MVNGPWTYAAPQSSSGSTIFIVAPRSIHHGPVTIFSGEDAYDFNNPSNAGIEIDQTGQYTLTIPHLTTCSLAPSGPPPMAYRIDGVPSDKVNIAIGGSHGYSISLPKPCYFTSGFESRSKIDTVTPIQQPEKWYTTWMVLHYSVDTVDQAIVQGFQEPILFENNDIGHIPAISIVMGTDESDNNTTRRCDSTSVRSVKDEMALFGQDRHVQFPSVYGNQQSHTYEPGCEDQTQMLERGVLLRLRHDLNVVNLYLRKRDKNRIPATTLAFRDLDATLRALGPIPVGVRRELSAIGGLLGLTIQKDPKNSSQPLGLDNDRAMDSLSLYQTEEYVHVMTAGAGDCRGSQLDINGTIP